MEKRDTLRVVQWVAAATAAVIVAFGLLGLIFPGGAGASTYVIASAAVVLAAVAAGLPAGLLAVALSSAIVVYGHLPPIGVLHVDRSEEVLGLVIFVFNGLTVAAVGSLARRHLARGFPIHRRTRVTNESGMGSPARRLSSWTEERPAREAELVEALTGREVEVLGLLAVGMSNEDLAHSLFISVNTVKTHLKNIYGKLEVTSRTQAIARAQALGIIGVVGIDARGEFGSKKSPVAVQRAA